MPPATTPAGAEIAPQAADRMQAQLANLRSRDPGFVEAEFLSRVRAAFLKIQAAWSAGSLAPARAFISDGVNERFGLQLEMNRAAGIRNQLANVQVLSAELAAVESDPGFDTIHVHIRAMGVDSDVSLADGKPVRGSWGAEPFGEVWTFLRRPGAKTLKKPGLLEGFCPGCGASVEAADAAKCAACGAWIQSGEYDWLLVEITQDSEWSAREESAIAGWAALAQADPGLAPQHLEDRASVAFWRWQYAVLLKNVSPIKALGSPGWIADVSAAIAANTRYWNPAVGAADALRAETASGKDRVQVAIKWSGARTASGEPVVERRIFVLERSSGARTGATGFRTLACSGCGASPSKRDAEKCDYCGLAFNDGSRYWIVATSTRPSST
jgi:predicted lipid-binding transport protein (Tim44 family)